jgi:hypothetical protein
MPLENRTASARLILASTLEHDRQRANAGNWRKWDRWPVPVAVSLYKSRGADHLFGRRPPIVPVGAAGLSAAAAPWIATLVAMRNGWHPAGGGARLGR